MIREEILQKLLKSKKAKAKLSLALDKSHVTIDRYLYNNHIMLTTVASLDVIKEVLNVTEEEIFNVEPITA